MAYNTLKNDIAEAIKTNGTGDITGDRLQKVLLSIVNTIGLGYQFAGVATPTTRPLPWGDQIPRFWIAAGAGAYTNFGGVIVTSDIAVITWEPSTIGGKYQQTGVYTAPAALPVLELYDPTMWVGGFSGGVKEYIETYHPADGATFGVKISMTESSDDYYDGIATYSETNNGIAIVANKPRGNALNVWISAGDENAVYYTLAGGTIAFSGVFTGIAMLLTQPWDTYVEVVGLNGQLQLRKQLTQDELQVLIDFDGSIEGLPEGATTRTVYGTFYTSGGIIDEAYCVVIYDYPDGNRYYVILDI